MNAESNTSTTPFSKAYKGPFASPSRISQHLHDKSNWLNNKNKTKI